MKKIFLLLLALMYGEMLYAQDDMYADAWQKKSIKDMLTEIDGKWKLDENNNVTYTRIVDAEGLSKEEIFTRVTNYFTYNYGSGKSVIQTQDKEAGLIVGKGIYGIQTESSFSTSRLDTWHILRVDVKDGKARIILSLTEYERMSRAGNTIPTAFTSRISHEYPINKNGSSKREMTEAFYKSHNRAVKTLDALEKAIKEGTTSKLLENEEW